MGSLYAVNIGKSNPNFIGVTSLCACRPVVIMSRCPGNVVGS